jgi:hypothetical protein
VAYETVMAQLCPQMVLGFVLHLGLLTDGDTSDSPGNK